MEKRMCNRGDNDTYCEMAVYMNNVHQFFLKQKALE